MSELIKDVLFGDDCQNALMKGIETLSKAVKVSMGPMGRTVLIESPEHTHSIVATKDGVSIAKSIYLANPVENMACKIMKEAAEKTSTLSGDGTTCSIVLSEALILSANEMISTGINKTQVLRYMSEITKDIIEQLREKTIPCDDNISLSVAKISANNDDEIGKIISDAYKGVGIGGIVTVEKSLNSDTYAEVTKGLKIDRGYSSPLFITNRDKDECILENVCILVCDGEISNLLQLESVLKEIIGTGKKLLIISPCHVNAINTLAGNVMKGVLSACIIQPPSFGYKQHELMEDIALNVGATYFSEKTGDDLSHIAMKDLGFASKAIIGKNKTVIIGGASDEQKIKERVDQLKVSYELAKIKRDKDFINERIASLIGGVGVVYVGGNTDMEQKELYDRVEDSVLAVRSALEEGVISGGGLALYQTELPYCNIDNKEYQIARDIMLKAIKAPLVQILSNADMDSNIVYLDIEELGYGYNLKTGMYGNMIKMGVTDPLKVIRVALENATSVAITILSTNASINIARA